MYRHNYQKPIACSTNSICIQMDVQICPTNINFGMSTFGKFIESDYKS